MAKANVTEKETVQSQQLNIEDYAGRSFEGVTSITSPFFGLELAGSNDAAFTITDEQHKKNPKLFAIRSVNRETGVVRMDRVWKWFTLRQIAMVVEDETLDEI